MRDYKEKETKLQVEELLKYLEFDDVKDFMDPVQTKDFEEVNFLDNENVSESATDNESCSEDFEGKYI